MQDLPKHIALSAITSAIKCSLCSTNFDLTKFLGDGQESDLKAQIVRFIRQHKDCTQIVQIVLDKEQLFQIAKVTDSPEKFVIDCVEQAVDKLKL